MNSYYRYTTLIVIHSKTYIPFFAQYTNPSAGPPLLSCHTSQKLTPALLNVYSRLCHRLEYLAIF